MKTKDRKQGSVAQCVRETLALLDDPENTLVHQILPLAKAHRQAQGGDPEDVHDFNIHSTKKALKDQLGTLTKAKLASYLNGQNGVSAGTTGPIVRVAVKPVEPMTLTLLRDAAEFVRKVGGVARVRAALDELEALRK